MNRALTRSSRINKNLLLLAKIENNQFENSDIQLDELVEQFFETFKEHFVQKNISVDDRKRVKQFNVSGSDQSLSELKTKNNSLVNETISYYQTASTRFKNGKMEAN